MSAPASIAYFVTAHGFGHATRAAALMEAMHGLQPSVRFELFTTSPQWIFSDSLSEPFGYHAVRGDVGMVQVSALQENLPGTLEALQNLFPLDPLLLDQVAETLISTGCCLAVCDIAPLGIAAAMRAGIASVLVENFTWDWIYQPYLSTEPRLQPYIDYLHDLYAQVDHRIQTEPLCQPVDGAVQVGPIARLPRSSRKKIRGRLNIADSAKIVIVTMGGIPQSFEFMEKICADLDFYLIIPGADTFSCPHPKVILLPAHSVFFHPDLLQAADVIIGKTGYSTVCEAYFAGIPFGYVKRSNCMESQVLAKFIDSHMPSCYISLEDFHRGHWIERLPELLAMPRATPTMENCAGTVAQMLLNFMDRGDRPYGCPARR
jgi:hypothetical protein